MSDPSEFEKQQAYQDHLLALLPAQQRARMRARFLQDERASLPMLTELIAQAQKTRRASTGILILLLLLAVPLGCLLPFTILGSGFLALLLFATQIYLPARLERALWNIVLSVENERNLGLLLNFWKFQTRSLRAEMEALLVRLLPHLTSETFRTFNRDQRSALYSFLNYEQRDRDLDIRLAVLSALEKAGDSRCLGHVYLLTIGKANSYTAHIVREAAIGCLDHLMAHLDFGPLQNLPGYIDSAYAQMTTEGPDLPTYFTALLNLRRLLPQLTPSNYQDILSESHRVRLYSLAGLRILAPFFRNEKHSFGRRAQQLEIVRLAERLGDTSAIPSLEAYIHHPYPNLSTSIDPEVQAAVLQALGVLKPLAEQEKLGRILLRGASAPETSSEELLRAAIPGASETNPAELLRAASLQPKPSPALPYRSRDAIAPEPLLRIEASDREA